MLRDDSFADLVAARLLDYFGTNTSWPRRLWGTGTVLSLREVAEASEAVRGRALSDGALRWLLKALVPIVANDPGVDGGARREALLTCLRSDLVARGMSHRALGILIGDVRVGYLERWEHHLATPSNRSHPERAARAVAAHLLDEQLSPEYLHRWWSYRIKHEPGERTLANMVEEAETLTSAPPAKRQVLVVLTEDPGFVPASAGWRDAAAVSAWLEARGHPPPKAGHYGGLLLDVEARDEGSAVAEAGDLVDRLVARVAAGRRVELQLHPRAWVDGARRAYRLSRPRGLSVPSMRDSPKLFDLDGGRLDSAFELLSPLDIGPKASAVAGAWAAIEDLLVAPGDGERVAAADRLATIIACAFPRAELVALGWAHERAAGDQLAIDLAATSKGSDRARITAKALMDGVPLAGADSDRAAAERMRLLLNDPEATLNDVAGHVGRSLRQLYRQRNLVLHWGRTSAVALSAALRISTPLIAAGVDRVAHAFFEDDEDPLDLAARAQLELSLMSLGRKPVFALLD